MYCWNLAWRILSITLLTFASAAAAKSLQSCPTLCDPIDGSPPGSSAHGIFQARVLECVAMWNYCNCAVVWAFLEKEMATHSSTLAWRIPWREKPGRLLSMGSQRVEHDWATSLHLSILCIAFLWDSDENLLFPVLWPLLSFPNLLAYWVQHFHSIIFQDLK